MTTSGRARRSQQPATRDDAQQLEQEIERTRQQLGETVEQLAAKADVKSRAAAVSKPVQEAAAEQVNRALAKGASGVRQYRARLAVAAGILTAGYLVIRWFRHR